MLKSLSPLHAILLLKAMVAYSPSIQTKSIFSLCTCISIFKNLENKDINSDNCDEGGQRSPKIQHREFYNG